MEMSGWGPDPVMLKVSLLDIFRRVRPTLQISEE
jgi:hypothetical protein